jgi:two-component system nitrate/nitrite response regulator NarL
MKTIQVLFVDDHPIMRSALTNAFNETRVAEGQQPISIVESAMNGKEAIQACARTAFDVVLMELDLLDMNGYTASEEILKNNPAQKIILIAKPITAENIRRSLDVGASGHISRHHSFEMLIEVIHSVHAGKKFFESDVVSRFIEPDITDDTVLSRKELLLLKLICEGKNRKQIAKLIPIALGTVDRYKSRMRKKLGVDTDMEVVIYAIRHHLV